VFARPDLADVPVTDFPRRVEAESLSDAQRAAVAAIEDQLEHRDESSLAERVEALDRADRVAAPAPTPPWLTLSGEAGQLALARRSGEAQQVQAKIQGLLTGSGRSGKEPGGDG
jgi:hypothetical protein